MQCEQIGTACVILGGGRERKEDSVDPAVGIVLHKKVGDRIVPVNLLRHSITKRKPGSACATVDRGKFRDRGFCAIDQTSTHPSSHR